MFGIESIAAALMPVSESLALEAVGSAAAVLVPVRVGEDGSTTLVFTKRPDHMPRHAGEISFPGGRPEDVDDDLVATALREAREEVGIDPDSVRVIGGLPPITTFVSDFAVHPVVGEVPFELALTPHPGEVSAVLEYRLDALAQARASHKWEFGTQSFEADVFDMEGDVIWGATARILGMMLERIDALRGDERQR